MGSLHEKWGIEGLRSAQQIRFVLQRERSRADRTGDALAVISFTSRTRTQAKDCWNLLVEVCRARLRVTDEIGWLDDERLCVILPGTNAEGGWKVADDICVRFPQKVEPPLCSVHAIGGQDSSNGSNNDGDGSRRNGAAKNGKHAAFSSRGVQSLDDLFVQDIPIWKRALDISGSFVGLLFAMPIMLLVALAMKLTAPGPVFFQQKRSGRGGKPFVMYKFRTMVVNAEAIKHTLSHLNERDGPAFKIEKDPRITTVGRFLRATSLDELPQLWNVLKGEMSLVGPRPLPCDETAASAPWQRRRLDVNPGLTCTWQIKGRSGVLFADWIRMDMQYIRSMSLIQDLKLLLLTIPAVLLRQGAH